MPKSRFRVHESQRPADGWARLIGTGARGRKKVVHEAWVEAVVDDEWMAAYRLLPGVHSEPVIAEIRIFPLERKKGRPPGRWSAEVLGIDAKTPENGISAEVIRQVRVGEHRQVGMEFFRWLRGHFTEPSRAEKTASVSAAPKKWSVNAFMPTSSPTPKRGRPQMRSDEFYAKLAEAYTQRVAQGSPHPTEDVARRRKLSAARVRDLLHTARQRGLLSTVGRGRSGGDLTPKALAVLNPEGASQ